MRREGKGLGRVGVCVLRFVAGSVDLVLSVVAVASLDFAVAAAAVVAVAVGAAVGVDAVVDDVVVEEEEEGS